MAFRKAVIEIKQASVGTGIKAGLRKTKRSAARLTLSVSVAVARRLDWQDSAKLETLIGEGDHHGLIRLRKNNSVGQATVAKRETAKGAWFCISLGVQDVFVDRSEAARWCQWELVEDGYVEIVLPAWADVTAPVKKALVPTKPVSAAPQRVSVTGRLMGDPEPGRREAVAQIGAK